MKVRKRPSEWGVRGKERKREREAPSEWGRRDKEREASSEWGLRDKGRCERKRKKCYGKQAKFR